MENVSIKWTEGVIDYSQLDKYNNSVLDESGFYALLSGIYNRQNDSFELIRLLYIGQAYKQDLRTRIQQRHEGYKCINSHLKKYKKRSIIVMLGTITKTSLIKITQSLYDDIECCLINSNKPLCNQICKEKYTGRDIKILNKGDYSPLKQISICKRIIRLKKLGK